MRPLIFIHRVMVLVTFETIVIKFNLFSIFHEMSIFILWTIISVAFGMMVLVSFGTLVIGCSLHLTFLRFWFHCCKILLSSKHFPN